MKILPRPFRRHLPACNAVGTRGLTVLSILLVVGLTGPGDVNAQYHFRGLKGVTVEYGVAGTWDQYYSAGVQKLLSRRFQVEILAAYQQDAFIAYDTYSQYDVQTQYQIERWALNETISYSFLRLLKCLYLNLGVGLSQGYQRSLSVKDQAITLVDERQEDVAEPRAFDPKAIASPDDRLRVGGHVGGLAELYLHRYITLLVRYRYTYWLGSHWNGHPIDQAEHQTSVGIRINF